MTASFSPNEAGFLLGQSTAAVNRAIDRGAIGSRSDGPPTTGKARRIGPVELRTLAVLGAAGSDLTPAGRRKVSAAMRRLPIDVSRISFGAMEFRLEDLDAHITERLFRLERLRQLVEPQPDGDPLIRGTRSSVYAVAAFTRGQTIAEIIEDCPGLTPALVEAAVEYVKVYPRPGRPLPPRSFKRMLADMATSGVWDVETDDDLLAPQIITI